MSEIIDQPPSFTWKKYALDFGLGNGKVVLWCPQTSDFDEHEKGNWKRKGGIDKEELEEFKAFQDWKKTMQENLARQERYESHLHHDRPYSLRSIHVQAITRFPQGQVGFVKIEAWIQREATSEQQKETADPHKYPVDYRNTLYETIFLRGGSVAVLMILRPSDKRDERWVILTEQARVPACSLRFIEIPAGMMDAEHNFAGVAAREIAEETGLKIPESELVNMTELALEDSHDDPETLAKAMYPSPGGCDEYISLFLWEKEMDRVHIEALKGKITGLRTAGETITLRLVKYTELWKVGARDAKTLGAWALYEGLSNSGGLRDQEQQRQAKKHRTDASLNAFLKALKGRPS
ncbi:NUDIX domain-containing protein [Diaporthe helianthi]|uniref:NUDIX domain-containing protein n=1 Tax=Diaporthe helianthi TaxID=158607 RepID=A0A2P5HF28_DIAHE|nr:NUDIX domain-containing protein [Diaporthe helianthi]